MRLPGAEAFVKYWDIETGNVDIVLWGLVGDSNGFGKINFIKIYKHIKNIHFQSA